MLFFKVSRIEFDFEMEPGEFPDEEYQQRITEENLGVWEVEDEESLTDEISDFSGWCIKSMEYYPIES
jgi:hypothetical protein